ncbi:MAG: hypothetical protein O2954_20755 [bacterium]|nr:hypothetical protein [bacterium]
MTTDQATLLRDSIQTLLNAIYNKEDITEQLQKVDLLQKELAPSASPQLRHFLENRGYTKALDYLNNNAVTEDPKQPACEGDHR